MNTNPIPEEFHNHYESPEIRQIEWDAFNDIRKLLGCPSHLKYKDANDWILSKLEVSAEIGTLNW